MRKFSSYWTITAATLKINQGLLIILHGINYSMKTLTSLFSTINWHFFYFHNISLTLKTK